MAAPFYLLKPHFTDEDSEAPRGYVTCQDLTGVKCPTQALKVAQLSLKPVLLTAGGSCHLLHSGFPRKQGNHLLVALTCVPLGLKDPGVPGLLALRVGSP